MRRTGWPTPTTPNTAEPIITSTASAPNPSALACAALIEASTLALLTRLAASTAAIVSVISRLISSRIGRAAVAAPLRWASAATAASSALR